MKFKKKRWHHVLALFIGESNVRKIFRLELKIGYIAFEEEEVAAYVIGSSGYE